MAEAYGLSEEQLLEMQHQIDELQRRLSEGEDAVLTEDKAEEKSGGTELNGSGLRLSDDHMSAWLNLTPPGAGKEYRREEIMQFLWANGVISGYHTSNISAILKKKIYYKEVLVAKGSAVKEGRDGYFDYRFKPEQMREPAVRSDGSVDYSSMNMLQNVAKGDVVAVYRNAVSGSAGCTVTGEEIKCSPARELPPIRGRNIRRLEDGVTYVSDIDGKVEVKNGRVDVQNVHEIRGDVTYVTGKVEFYGDIIIYGNVESGVMIRAGRNIIIKGITEAVTMNAGGDIVMEKGLVGGKKAKISARGSVFADFVENANIDAAGDVKSNVIMNSTINCEGKILLTGQKGTIIGGYVHGLMGVEAVSLGNDVEVKTIIHAGADWMTYKKNMELHKREQKARQLLEQTVEDMAALLRAGRAGKPELSGQSQKRLLELNHTKDECFTQIESIKQDRAILDNIIEKSRNAKIVVNGSVSRGVTICIDNAQLPIERSTSFMKYSCENGVINGEVVIY